VPELFCHARKRIKDPAGFLSRKASNHNIKLLLVFKVVHDVNSKFAEIT